MRKELELIEMIEAYLLDQMSPQDKTAFEEAIRTNSELAEQVAQQKLLTESLSELKASLAIEKAGKSYHLRNLAIKLIIAIITAAAIVLGIYYGIKGRTDSESAIPPVQTEENLMLNGVLVADSIISDQVFTISAGEDTLIIGKSGLVLAIPSNSFLTEEGKGVSGAIELRLKEAISNSHILMAGLSTMSDDKLLETAGMFKLTATQDGKELKIGEKGILGHLPEKDPKPGMMLFDGHSDTAGNINWVNPKPLEQYLVPVDIMSLDFYPPGYVDSLKVWGFKTGGKKKSDSLYLSFECDDEQLLIYSVGPMERDADVHSDITPPEYLLGQTATLNEFQGLERFSIRKLSNGNIEILDYVNRITYYAMPYSCPGVKPSAVLAVWDRKFNHTNLATREFEMRMPFIHNACINKVLEVYVNNLDKPLYYADSMAAQLLGEHPLQKQFLQFAALHEGRVQQDNKALGLLAEYYRKQSGILREASLRAQEKVRKEFEAKNREAGQKRMEQFQREQRQWQDNYSREFMLNAVEAYRQIGQVYPPRDTSGKGYTFTLNSTGWKNLDQYVAASTLSRTTLDYNSPDGKKKARIEYRKLEVKVTNDSLYDQVFVYLLPDKLNSFQRMKNGSGIYTENLNELISYGLLCIGYKDGNTFYAELPEIKEGSRELSLQPISQKELRTKLDGLGKPSQSRDLVAELDYRLFAQADNKRVREWNKMTLFRTRLERVIFPCREANDTDQFLEILPGGLFGRSRQ